MLARWIVVAGVLFAMASAHANQPRRRGSSPQDEARELYKKGMTHYEIGEFDAAIDEFKHAYQLTSAPGLLFNIAQVYRMKKDPEQAVYFYRTYLRLMPDAPNRADVEVLIRENQAALDAAVEERHRAEAAAAAAAAQAATPPVAPAPAPPPRHWRLKLWGGVGVAAVGVAALAGGIGAGARASSDADQISRANAQRDVPWDAERQRLYRDGQSSSTAATVLYAVGGALVAGGAVLTFLGARERPRARSRSMALVPLSGGAAAVVSCEF